MTTAQLTVLWDALLLICVILLLDATANRFIIISLVTILTIYTLKPHSHAKKKWLPLTVLGPFAGIGLLFYGWLQYTDYRDNALKTLIEFDKVVVTDAALEKVSYLGTGIESLSDTYLKGTVQNLSYYHLTSVIVQIQLPGQEVDGVTEKLDIPVLPQTSSSFSQKVGFPLSEYAPMDEPVSIGLKVISTIAKK
jgi:hypothetical protein